MMRVTTDVFVVGAGGAGMYAAISAAREGTDVIVADKSLISRGGATIMAQMTVASAVGHEEPAGGGQRAAQQRRDAEGRKRQRREAAAADRYGRAQSLRETAASRRGHLHRP